MQSTPTYLAKGEVVTGLQPVPLVLFFLSTNVRVGHLHCAVEVAVSWAFVHMQVGGSEMFFSYVSSSG